MNRYERGSQVAYRDRRWGWSLVFFCLALPVSLLVLQEAFERHDRPIVAGASAATLACIIAAFALLRTNALLIDREAGTLISSRLRFFWGKRQTFALSQVHSVRLGVTVVERTCSAAGRGPTWLEHVYRILIEVDQTEVPVEDGIAGTRGKTLASWLAHDLGVRVRNEF